jgi:hypothetical protein
MNPEAREAVDVYIWDSEDAARAFFSEELSPAGVEADLRFSRAG